MYLPERSIPPFADPGFEGRASSDRTREPDRGRTLATTAEDSAGVYLQPVPGLEWSLATESSPRTARASSPAAARCSWLHTAAESKVLRLFRKLDGLSEKLPSPWWLRALAHGRLPDRATAFRIEDEIHAVLAERPGWVFVPWAHSGETGYWEYGPSDREPMVMPTTVLMTDKHPGWVHVLAAHRTTPPVPLPVDQACGLLAALPQVESLTEGDSC